MEILSAEGSVEALWASVPNYERVRRCDEKQTRETREVI